MTTTTETSDGQLLDHLRRSGALSVAQLVEAMSVTATAVRQRLSRLMVQGLVERDVSRGSRGRPSHRYGVTEKARRQAGSNFSDLAIVLWDEIRAVKDPEVRRGLLARIAHNMASLYARQIEGTGAADRMRSLAALFDQRGIPLTTVGSPELPVLTVLDCPYPELVERDRSICAVEKMLFQELLGHDIHLAQCRLDGHSCCEFATN